MPEHALAVVDMHVDTPYQIVQKGRSLDLPEGHATGAKLQAGHYFGIVYPIYIPDYLHDGEPRISDADEILSTIQTLVARHDWLHFERAGAPTSGVTAFISIEGAGAFASDIKQIDRFIDAGVRLIGPVHASDSPLATSATGKNGDREGLSELGQAFCRRVYQRGALVDVSHMSDRSFADLVSIAKAAGAPIVATHSNARKLANHPRNLTDDQLRKVAESGGVVGLNLHSTFLSGVHLASMKHAVDQVLYMVEIAGVNHVGIGSDFDGARPPDDLADASKMPLLGAALRARGLSEGDVRKIFSLNALRMLRWSPSH